MGEILLAGTTHYPLLMYTDDAMTSQMEKHWKSDRVPEWWRNQKNWPKEMQEEYGPDGQLKSRRIGYSPNQDRGR